MLGAIIGDIVGSRFEFNNLKSTEFPLFQADCRFTDDTVLTVAVADSLINNVSYAESLRTHYYRYPQAGYGSGFQQWAQSNDPHPYNSWGNGSAMRVSPIGFAFNTLDEVLKEAQRSAEVTHNHPEGVKGAQAVAASIFLARQGYSKEEIQQFVEERFGYNLHTSLVEIRPQYDFDVSCQGSVPWAIRAFLEADSFENALRRAVSIGGDSDTLACIAGGIAQAYFKHIPAPVISQAKKFLDQDLLRIMEQFSSKFGLQY